MLRTGRPSGRLQICGPMATDYLVKGVVQLMPDTWVQSSRDQSLCLNIKEETFHSILPMRSTSVTCSKEGGNPGMGEGAAK